MNTEEIIESRRGVCSKCGRAGIHVDTDAGEIVVMGEIVASVEFSGDWLMADERGRLVCDDCDPS